MPIRAGVPFSWQEAYAKVLPPGDLEWTPKSFRLDQGASLRYIDFDAGKDESDGTTIQAPWKHHPWDSQATGKAKACRGIHTYVFQGALIWPEFGWVMSQPYPTRVEVVDLKQHGLGFAGWTGLRCPKSSQVDDRLLQLPPANRVEDGHSIAFVGYEDDASEPGGGIFRIRNSWGPQWGKGGYCILSYAYVRAYLNDALWLEWGPPYSEVPQERFLADAPPVRARNRCEVSTQAMKPWGSGLWSHGKQLFCRAESKGFVELEFHVRQAGRYRLCVEGTVAPDYGIMRIALDGKPTGRPFDLYSGMVGPSGPLELGVHELAATKHPIRFTAVGKNAVSKDFWFGVSTIDLLAPKREP
jgi:hypothetical protein